MNEPSEYLLFVVAVVVAMIVRLYMRHDCERDQEELLAVIKHLREENRNYKTQAANIDDASVKSAGK